MVPSLKHEFFIPGIFHLIFLDRGWPWVTETAESETTAKWGTTVPFSNKKSQVFLEKRLILALRWKIQDEPGAS